MIHKKKKIKEIETGKRMKKGKIQQKEEGLIQIYDDGIIIR